MLLGNCRTAHIADIEYLSLFARMTSTFVPLSARLALKYHFPSSAADFLSVIEAVPVVLRFDCLSHGKIRLIDAVLSNGSTRMVLVHTLD